jgi:hypothetical protein
VYECQEYAETVYENCVDYMQKDAKQAKLYAEGQVKKISNLQLKEIILKAFKD